MVRVSEGPTTDRVYQNTNKLHTEPGPLSEQNSAPQRPIPPITTELSSTETQTAYQNRNQSSMEIHTAYQNRTQSSMETHTAYHNRTQSSTTPVYKQAAEWTISFIRHLRVGFCQSDLQVKLRGTQAHTVNIEVQRCLMPSSLCLSAEKCRVCVYGWACVCVRACMCMYAWMCELCLMGE